MIVFSIRRIEELLGVVPRNLKQSVDNSFCHLTFLRVCP